MSNTAVAVKPKTANNIAANTALINLLAVAAILSRDYAL